MTVIQFIERNGKREFAVIPIELYERLSAVVANTLLDGEQPVKVWR